MYGFTYSREALARLYSMADVMVNVSREDTLSLINVECQACGTPVVAYDVTGIKESICPQGGFSVESGDYKSLYNMVLHVKKYKKEYFGSVCTDWISNYFDRENNYMKYVELYKSML